MLTLLAVVGGAVAFLVFTRLTDRRKGVWCRRNGRKEGGRRSGDPKPAAEMPPVASA